MYWLLDNHISAKTKIYKCNLNWKHVILLRQYSLIISLFLVIVTFLWNRIDSFIWRSIDDSLFALYASDVIIEMSLSVIRQNQTNVFVIPGFDLKSLSPI